jgi:hypothetical protein
MSCQAGRIHEVSVKGGWKANNAFLRKEGVGECGEEAPAHPDSGLDVEAPGPELGNQAAAGLPGGAGNKHCGSFGVRGGRGQEVSEQQGRGSRGGEREQHTAVHLLGGHGILWRGWVRGMGEMSMETHGGATRGRRFVAVGGHPGEGMGHQSCSRTRVMHEHMLPGCT